MNELQKIAAEMRRYGALDSTPQFVDRQVQRWADALDALATQEPVAWRWNYGDGHLGPWHPMTEFRKPAKEIQYAYAAPQPAPPQPKVKYQDIISALESSWDRNDRLKALRALGIDITE